MSPIGSPFRPLALASALALAAACTTVRHDQVSALRASRFVDSELVIRPEPSGLARPLDGTFRSGELDDERTVTVRCKILALEPELLTRAVGTRGESLVALTCERGDEARVLDELESLEGERVAELDSIALSLHGGQEGYVSVIDQTAFVSAYTVKSSGDAALADPEVAVAQDGLLLQVTADLDASGESVTLDLVLTVCELEKPFAQREVPLAGGHVTIQEPTGLTRELSTRVALSREEALVIGGGNLPIGGSGRALLLFVEAESSEASEEAPESAPAETPAER